MKTITRELAHVGMFGPDGVTITQKHLADCKETFDGKCPATLGHALADWMPKFGNVQSVELRKNGDSLVGKVEVNDLLADAVDAKFYEDLSVGIQKRKSDGKHYLHHLAFLGAVPPKIRDLKVFSDLGVLYCGDEEEVVMFADQPPAAPSPGSTDDRAAAATKITNTKQRASWSLDDAKSVIDQLGSWATEMALSGQIPDELRAQAQTLADTFAQTTGEAGKEEDVETKEELAAAKADNEKLKKELADSQAAVVATAKEGLRKAMEGRIPKAKQGLVLELADRLDVGQSIELADEGGNKEKVSSLEVLRRVLEAIPKPVAEGRVDLADDGTAGSKKSVAVSFDKA